MNRIVARLAVVYCAAVAVLAGCGEPGTPKAIPEQFPATVAALSAHNTPNTLPVETGRCNTPPAITNNAGAHTGIWLQANTDAPKLLIAKGTLPELRAGDQRLSANELRNASQSTLINGFPSNDHHSIAIADNRITDEFYLFAGSVVSEQTFAKQIPTVYTGSMVFNYRLASPQRNNLPRNRYAATARLEINQRENRASLDIILLERSSPFSRLIWKNIRYCAGTLQSTGGGHYRLFAPSGRITQPLASGTDKPSGTAVFSGFLYGIDRVAHAGIAFTIFGQRAQLYGVASLRPEPS